MILFRRKKVAKNGENGKRKIAMKMAKKNVEVDGENGERKIVMKMEKKNAMILKVMEKKNAKNGENGERKIAMKMEKKNVEGDGENGERKTVMKMEKKKYGKWKKWREENTDETSGEKRERRGRRFHHGCPRGAWGGPRGRGAWRRFNEEDSDSAEDTRPVEEIKKEINSLKEEIGVLVTKKKGLWEELVGLKSQIKNLRQNEGTSDEILKVREMIMEKKRVVREYHVQIANSKNRIWKLKSALVMRVDTN